VIHSEIRKIARA